MRALRTGTPQPTGTATIALPKGEHVQLVLTIHSDPISGEPFGYATRRAKGKAVFGDARDERLAVAADGHPDTLRALRRQLVTDLTDILTPIDRANRTRAAGSPRPDWGGITLQTYVFDTFERDLLVAALLRVVEEEDDQGVVADALRLLFHFQHPEVVRAEEHPADDVPFPLVVLTEVLRTTLALPIPVAYQLGPVSAVVQPDEYGAVYRGHDAFDGRLSNRMRGDVILRAWATDDPAEKERRLAAVRTNLALRARATASVLEGLRQRLADRLWAWPPPFRFPTGFDLAHPELSRLAFIARYERVLAALEARRSRARPLEERLATGDALLVEVEEAADRQLIGRVRGDGPRRLRAGDAVLLTPPEDPAAVLAVDDLSARRSPPPRHRCAFGRLEEVAADRVVVGWLRPSQALREQGGFTPGTQVVIDRRASDVTTERLVSELCALDEDPDPSFVALLRDPVGARRRLTLPDGLAEAAAHTVERFALTPSQRAAFDAVLDHDLQLVWGPPGSGKTRFLAATICALCDAHAAVGLPLRVLVTAATHTAIDNVLRAVRALDPQRWVGKVSRGRRGLPDGVEPVPPDELADTLAAAPQVVVGSTVWQLCGTGPERCRFDLVVIDEGSQLTVGQAAIAIRRLSRGRAGQAEGAARAARLVIAGDPEQLPPVVLGSYPEVEDAPPLHDSILGALRAVALQSAAAVGPTAPLAVGPQAPPAAPPTASSAAPPAASPAASAPLMVELLEQFRLCDVLCRFAAETIYPEGFRPATTEVATRRLHLARRPADPLAAHILDPDRPAVVCVLEGVAATAENRVEAALVARLVAALYRSSGDDPERFAAERCAVISPHHVQIAAIRAALREVLADSAADLADRLIVDTVDRMQGQERDVVVVSYGVADVEYALGEREFIYSRNRLNVAITRARVKAVVCTPRPLLDPPVQALESEVAARGIAFMQGWARWVADGDERRWPLADLDLGDGELVVWRR